jgi:hypothetical protein
MAGELITADGQFELRALLFGEGTIYTNRPGSPKGLGVGVKTNDVQLGHADGVYTGPEYRAARLLSWDIQIVAPTGEAAFTAAAALLEAFSPSSTDLELWGQLPGFGLFWFLGRPRGCDLVPIIASPAVGHIELHAEFLAGDPTMHSGEES